jgi:hypothetical protein
MGIGVLLLGIAQSPKREIAQQTSFLALEHLIKYRPLDVEIENEPVYMNAITGESLNFSDFVSDQDELEEIAKFQESTLEDLGNSAESGNREALFILGILFRSAYVKYLSNHPLDAIVDPQELREFLEYTRMFKRKAKKYISLAASLGLQAACSFLQTGYWIGGEAPGDFCGFFLSVIYWLVLMQKDQAVNGFFELRDQLKINMVKNWGIRIWNKIEKIAEKKIKLIRKNQAYLVEAADKFKALKCMKKITDQDLELGNRYWFSIWEKDTSVKFAQHIRHLEQKAREKPNQSFWDY